MIYVDYREGSSKLVAPLRKAGLPAEEVTLEFGDLYFEGKGPDGPVAVGIEYKQLPEWIQSIRNERFTGLQAIGMRDTYDYRWLLVEGEVNFDAKGRVLRRKGRKDFTPMGGGMGVSELFKREIGLHLRGGITPYRTRNLAESIKWIEALYRVWTDVAWRDHDSHLGIYRAPSIVPLSAFAEVATTWPAIGVKRAKAAEARFKNIYNAVNATMDEWAELEVKDADGKSKRLGTKDAIKIVDFLRGVN